MHDMDRIDLDRAIYAPGGDPLEYPSAMPEGPLLVTGEECRRLFAAPGFAAFRTATGEDADALLARRGAAPLSGRVTQVAFGAHRNPANIAWKLAAHAREAGGDFSRDFVMLPAFLRHADVVACNISSGGHMYSGLLTTRPGLPFRCYLEGTRCPVTLLLFDQRQMEAMHRMAGIPRPGEGPGGLRCDLAVVEANLDETHVCEAQTYSVAVPFLGLGGRPVAFAAVATEGRRGYPALSQRDMFRAVNAVLGAEPERPGATPIIDTRVWRLRAKRWPSAMPSSSFTGPSRSWGSAACLPSSIFLDEG